MALLQTWLEYLRDRADQPTSTVPPPPPNGIVMNMHTLSQYNRLSLCVVERRFCSPLQTGVVCFLTVIKV
jgi:hypothetical protein